MFSVAPNIVLAPNMTQNAERKHRTQDANTAPIRPQKTCVHVSERDTRTSIKQTMHCAMAVILKVDLVSFTDISAAMEYSSGNFSLN